jgi:hypothetical protein
MLGGSVTPGREQAKESLHARFCVLAIKVSLIEPRFDYRTQRAMPVMVGKRYRKVTNIYLDAYGLAF